ncbi:hypothetical protein NC652_032598 [Populus alba x Populus x berolinensis]|nr:hypothetical protein NC651_031606 [Populus alba x Populus x berolinensis]KAJ6879089.1 hypothetical protein NC652_032598 [Populus alba x Populus x berolinensis]
MGFFYDAEVLTWSSASVSPTMSTRRIYLVVCFYLFPRNNQSMKVHCH